MARLSGFVKFTIDRNSKPSLFLQGKSPEGICDMRSRELQAHLADLTGRTPGEIDQRTRVLRMLSELRSGPRGFNALHLTMAEAVFHFLALVARRVPDVQDVTQLLSKECRYVQHHEHHDLIQTDPSLAAMMIYTMEQDGSPFQSFELHESGRFAWANVLRSDGRRAKLLFLARVDGQSAIRIESPADYDLVDSFVIGNRFVISATHLRMVGKQVQAGLAAAADGEADESDTEIAPEAAALRVMAGG